MGKKILELYGIRLKKISQAYNRKQNPISKDELRRELRSIINELNSILNRGFFPQ